MSVISIVITLIIIGIALWIVNKYIPMDRKIKSILNGLVVVLVIVWLLGVFGVLDSVTGMNVRSIR